MATFTAVKNRGGGRGALGGVLRYTQQDEKTLWEGQRLVTGWNCTAQSALSEMQLTKERFRKTDGRQYYHFVQSFAEADDLTPQEAHAIGLELAQREFPNFEVLVATHIDTDHLHSHLIVNSVSFQNGRKLHQSAADLQAHRLANDEICAAHGLDILPPPEKQVKQKRIGHPRVPIRRQGRELEAPADGHHRPVHEVRATKEEFLSLMESEGYQVRWTEGRKNITYTTPNGMKCRDDRLHETNTPRRSWNVNSESGRRLSLEELKQRNRASAPSVPAAPPDTPTRQDWENLLAALTALYRLESINSGRLERLEASVAAQEALFRALSRQVGQLPTQAQLEALAGDVAQIQATLKPAGKKSERWFSLPKLRLPYLPWSSLLLGLTALLLTGGVLWAVWFSCGKSSGT